VILRKGIQYLVEAARLLEDRSIRFPVVGPIHISDAAVASAPPSVDFQGPVTHDRVGREYAAADVFVLPTMSDNHARAELEALAHGLPVVTTTNCGTAVDDGHDGLIVPAGDAESLAKALARLDDDRDLVAAMASHTRDKAAQFSIARYRDGLDAAAVRFAPA
jgi:glycosyltransferase involved in cell wall biosynthesis